MNTSESLRAVLRERAAELKECFTKYTFYSIAISGVVFGVSESFQSTGIYSALSSIVVVALLLAVASIGTYKYGVANRCLGYILHLDRVRLLGPLQENDDPLGPSPDIDETETSTDEKGIHDLRSLQWRPAMKEIGWEEAMRAWRIVQPTIFQRLYRSKSFQNVRLKDEFVDKRKNEGSTFWFEPSTLVNKGSSEAAYHPGRYLRLMLSMLHILAIVSTGPVWLLAYKLETVDHEFPDWMWIFILITAVCLMMFVAYRIMRDLSRVNVLEGGILSIHSSAVLWQAVVVAHYRALYAVQTGSGTGLEQYTATLAQLAVDLASDDNIRRIDSWVGYTPESHSMDLVKYFSDITSTT